MTLRVLRGAAAGRGASSARPAGRAPDRRPRARRRARVHRPPQPRRPDDPGRAASRAEGPPGRDDRGHRRRRQRVRAVPDASTTSTTSSPSTAGSTAGPTASPTTGGPSPTTSPATTGGVAVNIAYLIGNSALRIAAVGWDEVAASAGPDRRPAGAPARGDGGGRVRAVDRARLPARRLRLDRRAGRRSWPRRRGSAASTTPTSATRSATRSSTRSARRSRSAAGGGGPVHITHFYHRATFPGSPEDMLAARRRRPGRGPRRHLRPLPVRVGQHPAPDHAADLGPGGRRRQAQGAPRRPRRSGRGSATSWPPVGRCSPAPAPGTTSGSATSPGRSTNAGRAGRSATTWPRPGSTRSTRCATCSCREDLRVNEVDARARIGPASTRSSSTTSR